MILVPFGFLVLIVLGAIAVDSSVAYMAQRQLSDAVASAASDAANAGLSRSSFYGDGALSIDEQAASQQACTTFVADVSPDLADEHLWIGFEGTEVTMSATATVGMVFGKHLPGNARRTVRATASASGVQAADQATLAPVTELSPLTCN